MVLLLATPLIYILIISFFKAGEYYGIVYEPTAENYTRMMDPDYIGVFLKSFAIAGYSTLVTLLIGYPFAYFVTKLPKKWQARVLLLVIIPFWTNALIRVYGWVVILQKKGIINSILIKTGLIENGFSMLYNDIAVLIGTIYILLPFMIFPIYNSIEKIDMHLVEAARDLGANGRQAFFHISLRLSMPGIMSGCLMVFVPSVGLFFITDLLGGANSVLLGNLIRSQFIEAHNWPFGAALSVMMTVLSLILIWFYKKVCGGEKMEMFI